MLLRWVVGAGTVPTVCVGQGLLVGVCCSVWGVSPFTVGQRPSARGKTAGVAGAERSEGALRRALPFRDGERRDPASSADRGPERESTRSLTATLGHRALDRLGGRLAMLPAELLVHVFERPTHLLIDRDVPGGVAGIPARAVRGSPKHGADREGEDDRDRRGQR